VGRALALLVLAACSATPTAHMIAEVERPPERAQLAAPVVFGPIAKPASVYNEAVAAVPSTEARDAIFTALANGHERDARLDVVSGELAALLASGGIADDDLVEFALHAHGIPEPMYSLLISRAATADAAIAELQPQLLDAVRVANAHVGIGGGDGQPFVVAIIHTSLVTLPPTIPRMLPAHGSFVFSAPVDNSMHSPRITVSYDDDREARDHPPLHQLDPVTYEATIACGDHKGNLWMLVEGFDVKNIAHSLLLLPVSCAEPLETTYRIEPRANTNVAQTPVALEKRLAAIINRERAAANVAVLSGDLRADNAAGIETNLMRSQHTVEHADTIGRLRDEGLLAPFTLEATLHAKDLATASEILLNHRGYREMLSQPEPTHIGISIQFDEAHQLFIAIELVSVVPKIDTDRIAQNMIERIDARRPEIVRKERPLKLVHDPALDHMAEKYIRNRVRGWSDKNVADALQHDTEQAFSAYKFSWRALTLLLDDDPSKVDIGPDKPFDGVGISVMQAPRNGALAGRTYVIVIYGMLRNPDEMTSHHRR
jgi:uncharacterized protein YkwD